MALQLPLGRGVPRNVRTLADLLSCVGVLLSILALPITKTISAPLTGERLTIFEFIVMATVLAWSFARTQSRTWSTVKWTPRLDLPLAALFVVAALSGTAVWSDFHSKQALLQYAIELVVLAYLLVLFVVTRDVLYRHNLVNAALGAWMAALGIVGIAGAIGGVLLVRCHTPVAPALVLWNARLISTFRNPNQLAAYLVPTLMVAAALGVRHDRWRPWTRAAGILGLVALFFSASRGGWVAFGAAGAVFVAFAWRRPGVWAQVAAAVALPAVLLAGAVLVVSHNPCVQYVANTASALTIHLPGAFRSAALLTSTAEAAGIPAEPPAEPQSMASAPVLRPEMREKIQHMAVPFGSDTASSIAFRAVMARYAKALASTHPFIGVGWGTMHLYVSALTNRQAYVDAHNMFLTVLAETGLLGAALFTWCIGWFAVAAVRLARSREPMRGNVVLAYGLVAALVGCLVEGLTFDAHRQRVLWLLFSMIWAVRTSSHANTLDPASGVQRSPQSSAAVAEN